LASAGADWRLSSRLLLTAEVDLRKATVAPGAGVRIGARLTFGPQPDGLSG
jgi:hypothetical protein